MAFGNTVLGTKQFGDGGHVIEWGTWTDASSAGTGDIIATTQSSGSPTFVISKIVAAAFTSDGSYEVFQTVSSTTPSTVTVTCTAGDSGTYAIIGIGG